MQQPTYHTSLTDDDVEREYQRRARITDLVLRATEAGTVPLDQRGPRVNENPVTIGATVVILAFQQWRHGVVTHITRTGNLHVAHATPTRVTTARHIWNIHHDFLMNPARPHQQGLLAAKKAEQDVAHRRELAQRTVDELTASSPASRSQYADIRGHARVAAEQRITDAQKWLDTNADGWAQRAYDKAYLAALYPQLYAQRNPASAWAGQVEISYRTVGPVRAFRPAS